MVIPNIGAFIAWGLITAFFIPTGWTPNENLAKLVGPMITYLLPLLIGYTGGKLVYGHRGGVVGAIVTAGIIIGSSVPMFLGAMIVGPLGAWLIKQFDRATEGKIPSGFEMLTNNFSAGILGAILAVLGLLLSFAVFRKSAAKLSAPGAIVIQFLGGIHEIYFPYVLSNPIMIVALWAGGLVADTIFVATNAGLVATPSPGSIFAYLAVTPPGQHFGVFLGVFAAAAVSFAVGSMLLRLFPAKGEETETTTTTSQMPTREPLPA